MLHFKNVVSVCKYCVVMKKKQIILCLAHVGSGTVSIQTGQLFIILITFRKKERQKEKSRLQWLFV